MENITDKNEQSPKVLEKIKKIFADNINKKICVVGSSCVGKSTLLNYLPEAIDMDDLLFGNKEKGIPALLTDKEIEYVCGPWTHEIGQFMTKKAHELIKIEAGYPVFGTTVFPSDLVVEIVVPDTILRERIIRRNANEKDVFKMKEQIELEIEKSGIEKIVIENI